jgi:hypothetical protein
MIKKHKKLLIGNGILFGVLVIHCIIELYYDSISWPFYALMFMNFIYYYLAPFLLFNVGYVLYRLVKKVS